MTSNFMYLTKDQKYTIKFQKGGQEDTQSFTPKDDGDTCNGKI